MEEQFLLDVEYQGEHLEFEASLKHHGYTYRIEVIVNEVPVMFEPDEERSYRAMVEPQHQRAAGALNAKLLQKIAERLQSLSGK